MIWRKGMKIKMKTDSFNEEGNRTKKWGIWEIVGEYKHTVTFRSSAGYNESFTKWELENMIRKGDIKSSLLGGMA